MSSGTSYKIFPEESLVIFQKTSLPQQSSSIETRNKLVSGKLENRNDKLLFVSFKSNESFNFIISRSKSWSPGSCTKIEVSRFTIIEVPGFNMPDHKCCLAKTVSI